MKSKGNTVGFLVVTATLIGIVLTFSQFITSSTVMRRRATELEVARQEAAKKIEVLLNLAFEDVLLTPRMSHSDPPPSPIRWTVEIVEPRLKKIILTAFRQHKGTMRTEDDSILLIAYKYDDF